MSFSTLCHKMQYSLTTAPVPKNRRIIDLNNVPLVAGTSFVKWHLASSSSAEHRGHTTKATIRDHKVAWDYVKNLSVRLTVDRNNVLQESEINFEVLQEYSPSTRAERIVLGIVKLNLAEFIGGSDDGEDVVMRRYLMQESKINSTLKISIYMKQTEGDSSFIAPPLKSAPVFGGIAGIMTAEQGDTDDGGNVPSMSSKARESGKLQDMYRRTLAASWTAQAGELPADKCIEDIFNGGDGWGGGKSATPVPSPRIGGGSTDDESDRINGDAMNLRRHKRNTSGAGSHDTLKPTLRQRTSSKDVTTGTVSGRGSIEQQVQSGHDSKRHTHRRNEVDEFTARDDLRSWEISANG